MYTLGLNLLHDTSAVLMKDEKVIGAIEEERLNRKKHTSDFPDKSINWLLEKESITLSEIDNVVVSFEFSEFKNNSNPFEEDTIKHLDESDSNIEDLQKKNQYVYFDIKDKMEKFGIVKWVEIPHHLSHAAGAFYSSGFDEAGVLVIDGRGENTSTSLYKTNGKEFILLEEYPIKDSLGHLYSYVTNICGLYNGIGQEGKTMGLAPYGENNNEIQKNFEKIITFSENTYQINRESMRELQKYMCKVNPFSNECSKSLAKYIQIYYEKVLIFLVNRLVELTGSRNIVLSGGVALNCEGNRKIIESNLVDNIFVQSAANDAGTALGAAIYFYNNNSGTFNKNELSNYLGPDYSDDEIKSILDKCKLKYSYFENIEQVTAKYLAKGMIVGWFQGRLEFGPRALGNRSILADPRKISMKNKINIDVKKREEWRPFAPSIIKERFKDYVDIPIPNNNMTISYKVKQSKQDEIQAAIHIDGTARFQTVDKKINNRYYNLICEFEKLTGVPVLLNTSFNGPEPIVCSPHEAISTFYDSGLDILVMGNYLIKK